MTPWLVRMIEEQFHRDDEDRLIREGRTPPALIRPGELEYRACPYAGSRHQHASPMNISALRQMSAHWEDILDACAVMREAYVEQRGLHRPELMDLWRVGQLGSALPWFYLLRGGGQPPPAFAAALAKITLGVGLWAQALLVEQLAGTWTPVELTPQAIYESSEATGTLIGATEVCSGPEKMMLRFFEVLVAGTSKVTSPNIAQLVADRERALLFGAHYANVKLLLWIHFLARRFVYADLEAALGPSPELRALIEGPCEPPDFFVVGPPDLAAVPPARRAMWIAQLAKLVLPMAADRSDQPLLAAAMSIGVALGTTVGPHATLARLDAILGEIASTAEDGFRDPDPGAPPFGPFDAAMRDRLLVQPPRTILEGVRPY
ncbi:hypothetical protein BH11MYX3_BH11MYX3_15560 [soil metagenome]